MSHHGWHHCNPHKPGPRRLDQSPLCLISACLLLCPPLGHSDPSAFEVLPSRSPPGPLPPQPLHSAHVLATQVLSTQTSEMLAFCPIHILLLLWNSNVTGPVKSQAVVALACPASLRQPVPQREYSPCKLYALLHIIIYNIQNCFYKYAGGFPTLCNILQLILFAQYLAFELGPCCSVQTFIHHVSLCCRNIFTTEAPPEPRGRVEFREMGIDIWFMFTSFGPINQEDIFISLFVKAFYKKRHPFSRFINRAVQRFYFQI